MNTAAGIKKRNGVDGESGKRGLKLISKPDATKPKRKGFTIGLCEKLSSVNQETISKSENAPPPTVNVGVEAKGSVSATERRLSQPTVVAGAVAGVAGLILGFLIGRRVNK